MDSGHSEGSGDDDKDRGKVEFMEGIYNVIPNQTIVDLLVENMQEIGPPKYDDEDLKFAREIAKTIPKDTKMAQLRKSKRPRWEDLMDKMIDDEIPKPWGEGETIHGSTDVADVSWQIPTVEFGTATWILGTPAHSWQAVAQSGVGLGHKSLIFAAKAMATTALDLLTEESKLKKAQEEHRKRVMDKKYKSPIPKDQKPPLTAWE